MYLPYLKVQLYSCSSAIVSMCACMLTPTGKVKKQWHPCYPILSKLCVFLHPIHPLAVKYLRYLTSMSVTSFVYGTYVYGLVLSNLAFLNCFISRLHLPFYDHVLQMTRSIWVWPWNNLCWSKVIMQDNLFNVLFCFALSYVIPRFVIQTRSNIYVG